MQGDRAGWRMRGLATPPTCLPACPRNGGVCACRKLRALSKSLVPPPRISALCTSAHSPELPPRPPRASPPHRRADKGGGAAEGALSSRSGCQAEKHCFSEPSSALPLLLLTPRVGGGGDLPSGLWPQCPPQSCPSPAPDSQPCVWRSHSVLHGDQAGGWQPRAQIGWDRPAEGCRPAGFGSARPPSAYASVREAVAGGWWHLAGP